MTDDENEELELVIPFVVVQSEGGPYEDRAFVAGFEAGHLDTMMRTTAGIQCSFTRYVPPPLVRQLDLMAMNRGFATATEPVDDDWSLMTFTFGSVSDD